jgi:hypothetical protein
VNSSEQIYLYYLYTYFILTEHTKLTGSGWFGLVRVKGEFLSFGMLTHSRFEGEQRRMQRIKVPQMKKERKKKPQFLTVFVYGNLCSNWRN